MPEKKTTAHRVVHQEKKVATAEVSTSIWLGVTAMLFALATIYLANIPLLRLFCAVLAVIFGILGLKTSQRVMSTMALIVGSLHVIALISFYGLVFATAALENYTRESSNCTCAETQTHHSRVIRNFATPTPTPHPHSRNHNVVTPTQTWPEVIEIDDYGRITPVYEGWW